MVKLKKIVIVSLISVLILGGIVYIKKDKKDKNANIKEVVVKEIKITDIKDVVKVDGTVEVKNEELIYLSKTQRVDEVFVEEGDEVKKGDLLANFDIDERNSIFRNIKLKNLEIKNEESSLREYEFEISDIGIDRNQRKLEEIEVAITKIDENLKIAKLEKENLELDLKSKNEDYLLKKKIFDINGISEKELNDTLIVKNSKEKDLEKKEWEIRESNINLVDLKKEKKVILKEVEEEKTKYKEEIIKNRNSIERTKIKIEKIRLEIEELKNELSKTYENIKSPVDGTVIEVNAEKNFRINLENSIFKIADINSQIITANINSRDIKKIKLGQKVKITSESIENRKKIRGKIVKISSIAKEESGSGYTDVVIPVEIEFESSESGLKPGYSVDLEIVISKKEQVKTIQNFALHKSKGKKYILIVDENNIVEKRFVEIGMEADNVVEVLNVDEGERVIMNGNGLESGEVVKVVEKIEIKLKKKKSTGTNRGMK